MYIGSLITDDGRSEKEINRRIMIARSTFTNIIITKSIENVMDGKDYQRGSIEKGGNRQINSETIQDEKITISRITRQFHQLHKQMQVARLFR